MHLKMGVQPWVCRGGGEGIGAESYHRDVIVMTLESEANWTRSPDS